MDYLGRQGLTICTVVALFELVPAIFAGNLVYLLAGVVASLIFLAARMGVREGSWPAAAMVFSLYLVGQLNVLAQGRFPGILSLITAAVLLSNLRAAFLASNWRPAAPDEDRPTRFNESTMDFLVDQLPAKAWPALETAFYAVGGAFLALTLIGLGITFWHRFGVLAHVQP
jgi:hypothetical protein